MQVSRVNVASRYFPGWIVGSGQSALVAVGGISRARCIERCEVAISSAQEAVIHIARVYVVSHNRPRRVNAVGGGALSAVSDSASTWGIERGDGVVRSPQEAVNHIARVLGVPRDRPRRVDAVGSGALASSCARARGIECRKVAFGRAHVAVTH